MGCTLCDSSKRHGTLVFASNPPFRKPCRAAGFFHHCDFSSSTHQLGAGEAVARTSVAAGDTGARMLAAGEAGARTPVADEDTAACTSVAAGESGSPVARGWGKRPPAASEAAAATAKTLRAAANSLELPALLLLV